ncbi:MAG: ATP:cob(I)alamin adenosyltransferase [Chloroflexi bacterium RBG_19FT_COMBO_56_12]|nr:MAG: ATP:cob(I)alamin adenosyltransferase [Chloroflexi bacterium RBG_19FT_COMBO_56_12]
MEDYNYPVTKFYTRSGDDGFSSRLGEGRLPKHDDLFEAIGALDEASSALGVARATCQAAQTQDLILAIQRDLYHLMAELSATEENAARFRRIDAARVSWLEQQVDDLSATVALPNEFIVPGDSQAGAALAMARTVVRRAERRVAGLFHAGKVTNAELLRYLNRLSSLCFVLELIENQAAGSAHPTLAKE